MATCAPPTHLEPLPDAEFDRQAAAHLLRRASFGGTPEEQAELAAAGLDAAVERLVGFPDRDDELEADIRATGSELILEKEDPEVDVREPMAVLRNWWIYRMVRTRFPLREKLVLFWHSHFASAVSKVVRAPLLHAQNETLRRHGCGRFRSLLGAVARDPAMLVYLDGRLNHREHPNENWAREVMELFALGVDRYSQEDVRQLARVFTGWTTPAPTSLEFTFRPADHDGGDKTLFGSPLAGRSGEAGIEEGEEALDRIVARADCPRFLAGKLLAHFASSQAPMEVQEALAQVLIESDLEIRAGLRALFRSRWFYAAEHRFALHKNGVDQVVGALRLLGVQNPHLLELDLVLRRLGMDLFEPPSVAGWPCGKAWLQMNSFFERWRLAALLSALPHSSRRVRGRPALDFDRLSGSATEEPLRDAPVLAERLAELVLQRPLLDAQRSALERYAVGVPARIPGVPDKELVRQRTRGMLQILLSSPEFAVS